MAGKSDIEAGAAYVRTYVKNSELIKGMNVLRAELQSAGKSVMQLGGLITTAGAAIKAPIMGAIAQFISMGSELQTIASRTGLGVQALAEFKHAAEQTGAALSDVEGASKSVTKNIADAAMGGQGAAVALSRLGTSAAQLKTMLPEQQLQLVADRLKDIKDPAQQAALATQLLGGTNLLPMIGQLGALRKEAKDLGLAPSEKAVADAANMGRMIKRALSGVSAAIFEIGAAVGPTLFPIGEAIIRIVSATTKWIRDNQEIVRTVAKVAGIVVAVGGVITGVGAAIFGLGTAFGAVATVATTVVGAITGIVTAVGTLAGLLAPLLAPLGLIILAVGGIAAAVGFAVVRFTSFTSVAKSAIGEVVAAIMPYVDIVRTMIGGIVDSLLSGNIGKAGQIAMAGLRLAFEMAKLAIVSGWLDVRNRILAVWDSVAVAATGALAFIGSLFAQTFTMLTGWDFSTALSAGWEVFRLAAKSAFDYIVSYAKVLTQALSYISSKIFQTVKDIAIVIPAITAITTAAATNAARGAVDPLAMVAATHVLGKALAASAEAMDRVGGARANARDDRENQADLWRQAQEEVIADQRDKLDKMAADAKAERAQLKAGGAGDVKPGVRPAAGDLAAGADLRASTGTFSGAALTLMGNDGGIARRQLRVQEEQRDLARKMEEHNRKGLAALAILNNMLGMGP